MDVVAILISALALGVSGWAFLVARGARSDARALGHLDLEPRLDIRATPNRTDRDPPYFILRNVGPVNAVQLTIDLISLRYSPKKNSIDVYVSGSEHTQYVEALAPHHEVSFPFEDHFLEVNARLESPVEHNVFAIRVTYRRDSDRRRFVARSFYFVNPDGRWVSENDSSLPELYDPIIDAAHASDSNLPRFLVSDVVYRETDDEGI